MQRNLSKHLVFQISHKENSWERIDDPLLRDTQQTVASPKNNLKIQKSALCSFQLKQKLTRNDQKSEAKALTVKMIKGCLYGCPSNCRMQ